MHDANERMIEYARDLFAHSEARAIVLYVDVFGHEGIDAVLRRLGDVPTVCVSHRLTDCLVTATAERPVLTVPAVRLTRFGQIRLSTFLGLSRGLFRPGDRLVSLSGAAGSERLDTLVFLDLSGAMETFAPADVEDLTERLRPEVFERVLRLAISLGHEGREGKPVGTAMVVGDTEAVRRHSEQMVLNPFQGHDESLRNVLDPAVEETVKEFAGIDGAFVIRGDGVIESAGTFLRPDAGGAPLPPGLGARHQSAAAITASTAAVCVTVSESNGTVRVFRDGRMILELKRVAPPRRADRAAREEKPPAAGDLL